MFGIDPRDLPAPGRMNSPALTCDASMCERKCARRAFRWRQGGGGREGVRSHGEAKGLRVVRRGVKSERGSDDEALSGALDDDDE